VNHLIKIMNKYYCFLFTVLLSLNASAFGVELSSSEVQSLYDTSDNYHTEGKYKQALEQLDLALTKAREIGAHSDIAVILRSIGIVYQINLSQLDKALIKYEQALKIFRQIGDESNVALVLGSIGGCNLDLNRMEISLSNYKEALGIHNKLGNEKHATLTLIGMGAAYLRLGQRDKAKEMFDEALVISQKNSDEITMAMSRAAMADIFATEGELGQALKNYDEALAVMRKTGNEVMISVYLSKLGDIYLKTKQFQKALKYYDEVHEINKRLKNNQFLLGVLFGSGQAHLNLNQLEKAIEKFNEAFEVSQNIGAQFYAVLSTRNISMIYFKLKKFIKSIEYSKKAVELIRSQGKELDVTSELSVASELEIIRSSYWGLKEDEKAIEYGLQALEIYMRVGSKSEIAWSHESLGMIYSQTDQQMMAIDSFVAALEVYRELDNDIAIARTLDSIGVIYRDLGKLDMAMRFLNDAINKHKDLNDEIAEAKTLSDIAVIYETRGQYEKALEIYKNNYEMFNENKDDKNSLSSLNSMGGVYQHMGDYGKAMKIFKKNLGFLREKGPEELINFALSRIGDIHRSWGQIEKALEYYEESLVFAKKYNGETSISLVLTSIGKLYSLREYDKALENFRQAAEINERFGSKIGLANSYINIGRVNVNLGKYQDSLDIFKKSLQLYREIGSEFGIASAYYEIGGVYSLQGQRERALKNFKKSLEIRRRGGEPSSVLESLNSIGVLYYRMNKYPLAIQYLSQAVDIAEKLRKTATGNARRDYLTQLIPLYKLLVTSHLGNGEFSKSFSVMEQARSRLLLDKLLNKNIDQNFPSLEKIQENIDDDSALVAFNRNSNTSLKYETIELFVITKNDYQGHVVNTKALSQYFEENQQSIKTILGSLDVGIPNSSKTENILDVLLQYYRHLIKKPSVNNKLKTKELSRNLYDLLISPALAQINSMKKLIVIPDGALSFIPFETLRGDDGSYLVEKFDVTYTQSMSIYNVVKDRNYADGRKSMFALGDAVYDSLTYKVGSVKNETQLAFLKKAVLGESNDSNSRSVGEAFSSLGYGSWSNLPGTKLEVEGISSIVKDATVLTGESVTEAKIKEMSQSGELSKFRVLHFATHGLTVSEFPELSSIVLSQFKDTKGVEDGYLRMSEIADLKIKADFVNLSACETGLGKLYAGEGVVGLTHAFLVAGANGLSVSLWNVADKSTAMFMTGMYQLVEQNGMTYSEAINEMKRQFITGKSSVLPETNERGMQVVKDTEPDSVNTSHPFYWAPFVYYGKN
jgi:tetratricopeptide (TPR) repeat protein/CHAT domain-containing protein